MNNQRKDFEKKQQENDHRDTGTQERFEKIQKDFEERKQKNKDKQRENEQIEKENEKLNEKFEERKREIQEKYLIDSKKLQKDFEEMKGTLRTEYMNSYRDIMTIQSEILPNREKMETGPTEEFSKLQEEIRDRIGSPRKIYELLSQLILKHY
jgi:predicted RNase H-like nuclease (RuvC/YqgF family)